MNLEREKMIKTTIQETENQEKILCPKAGTATSSPIELTASQSELKIPNTMIWMQRNVYEERNGSAALILKVYAGLFTLCSTLFWGNWLCQILASLCNVNY